MEQNDQRNLLLAFLLMFGVFMVYSTFVLGPQDKARREAAQQRSQQQQVQAAQQGGPNAVTTLRPRLEVVQEQITAGQRVALDAPAVDGSISLVGARIDDVALKGFYETIEDKLAQRTSAEVRLFSPENTERGFYAIVNWTGASGLPAEDAVWTRAGDGVITRDNPLKLTWTGEGVTVDRTIAVDDNYMFAVTDVVTNTGAANISVQPVVALRQRLLEEHLKPSPNAHAGVIGVYGEKKNQMRKYSDLNKGKGVIEEVSRGWIGLTTKYWMGAAVPEQGEPVTVRASVDKANGRTTFLAGYTTSPYTIQPGASLTKTNRIFAGAKRVAVLDNYEKSGVPGFTDAVDWSWIWFITKPFFWMLMLFNSWFGAFAWAIFALTIVVKAAFFPLQYKMYESMSRMRKLQPQMEAIKERFAADKQRQQQEMMKLYQQEKVNPLSGCLPLVPQMFVFWALFHTLYVTIEMRHTPFFNTWVQDMSAPDPTSIFNLFGLLPWNPAVVPFIGPFLMIGAWPLLYGATMFLIQSLSPPPLDPTQRMIMRWMPVVFLFFFVLSPAGLVIYWTWSNLITLGQQYYIMRRQGVETEFDKFVAKRLGKKASATPPAE